MTCKDCLHYEACNYWLRKEAKHLNSDEGFVCEYFADKSEWTHLPCKAGDIVYLPWRWYGDSGVDCTTVLKIVFAKSGSYIETDFDSNDCDFLMTYQGGRFWLEDFGRVVFSTKEQAEEALTKISNKEREM